MELFIDLSSFKVEERIRYFTIFPLEPLFSTAGAQKSGVRLFDLPPIGLFLRMFNI